MNKLQLMTGIDIPVPDLQLTIHQPTIKEISYIGEFEYFSALQLLCFNKATLMASNPKGASRLECMNDFQIFMTLVKQAHKGASEIMNQNSLESILTLLLPGYSVQILPIGIFLNNKQTNHSLMLNETNFTVFKETINEVTGINNATGGQNANYNPSGAKAAKIAAKLMRGRAKVAQQKHGSSDGILSRYVSILTVGLSSMSLEDCLNLTIYQLYDLIERYGLYVGWDLDTRVRLAGGKPDDKPDDWMKDLH